MVGAVGRGAGGVSKMMKHCFLAEAYVFVGWVGGWGLIKWSCVCCVCVGSSVSCPPPLACMSFVVLLACQPTPLPSLTHSLPPHSRQRRPSSSSRQGRNSCCPTAAAGLQQLGGSPSYTPPRSSSGSRGGDKSGSKTQEGGAGAVCADDKE